jgi:hypothetical protein
MKTLRTSFLIALFFCFVTSQAQRGHGHGRGRGPGHPYKVVVRHSPYRPHKVVVFHPYWRPNYAFHRRWVFFPHYNLYWDNWRNHYVFWNGTIWISQPTAPPAIVNVNLDKEPSRELKEDEDDVDDIYKSNEEHKKDQQGMGENSEKIKKDQK